MHGSQGFTALLSEFKSSGKTHRCAKTRDKPVKQATKYQLINAGLGV